MKKAFSLLEIIFVIAIIAITLSYLFKTSILFVNEANITKIKTEVSLIQNAINLNKNSRLRKGLSSLDFLDTASVNSENEELFGGVSGQKLLDIPLISTSTSQKKVGNFVKLSPIKYGIYIKKDELIEFEYKKENSTFNCISSKELCKAIN